jgi:hypothetical protein
MSEKKEAPNAKLKAIISSTDLERGKKPKK